MRVLMTRRYDLGQCDGINVFIFALVDAPVRKSHSVAVVATAVGDRDRIRNLFACRSDVPLLCVEGGQGRPRWSYEG